MNKSNWCPRPFRSTTLATLLLPLLLAGCGGGEGSTTQTKAPQCTVESVSLSFTQGQIKVGDTIQLTASANAGPAGCIGTSSAPVTWTSSDTAKAVVDATGKVTGVAGGSATISAAIAGKTASAIITVINLPATDRGMVINEVGSAWLELYNGSESPVNLGEYSLRSASWLPVNGEWKTYQEYTWKLPNVTIPARGYLFLRRTAMTIQQQPKVYPPTSKWVELGEPGRMFYTSEVGGFAQLIHNGIGVDFVRWGSSTTESSGGPQAVTNTRIPANGALVRTSLNTLEARNFPTPAGPNDVPADAVDNDGDGIPDSAEVVNGRLAGLDLYSMGARTGIPDIFVEVDAMESTDRGIDVDLASYLAVVESFRQRGFALHIDRGNRFSSNFDPSRLNLGNDDRVLPYTPQVELTPELGSINLQVFKHQNFDPRRLPIFHYAVMGSKMAGAVGRGELGGNDFAVAREGYSSFFAAKTFMHELGHNLGLQHGGFENVDKKPNYLSVMNPRYNCLIFSPESKECRMDYSDGSSRDMNEEHLDERMGWGRQPFFVDWNKDGAMQSDVRVDVNGDNNYGILKDYNDWAHLSLAFMRQRNQGGVGSLGLPHSLSLDVLGEDNQVFVECQE